MKLRLQKRDIIWCTKEKNLQLRLKNHESVNFPSIQKLSDILLCFRLFVFKTYRFHLFKLLKNGHREKKMTNYYLFYQGFATAKAFFQYHYFVSMAYTSLAILSVCLIYWAH